jgi:hypothetical protein
MNIVEEYYVYKETMKGTQINNNSEWQFTL